MALWLNRSGRHCEHESKFLKEERIYLTWDGLNRNIGNLNDRSELMGLYRRCIQASRTPIVFKTQVRFGPSHTR